MWFPPGYIFPGIYWRIAATVMRKCAAEYKCEGLENFRKRKGLFGHLRSAEIFTHESRAMINEIYARSYSFIFCKFRYKDEVLSVIAGPHLFCEKSHTVFFKKNFKLMLSMWQCSMSEIFLESDRCKQKNELFGRTKSFPSILILSQAKDQCFQEWRSSIFWKKVTGLFDNIEYRLKLLQICAMISIRKTTEEHNKLYVLFMLALAFCVANVHKGEDFRNP